MTVSSRKKDKNTPTPHDAAFRAFMASPEVARDFVELHLPEEYRQLCDVSTLRLEPCTFVDQDLKQYACDALFSMKTVSGEDGYIYIALWSTRVRKTRLWRSECSDMRWQQCNGILSSTVSYRW